MFSFGVTSRNVRPTAAAPNHRHRDVPAFKDQTRDGCSTTAVLAQPAPVPLSSLTRAREHPEPSEFPVAHATPLAASRISDAADERFQLQQQNLALQQRNLDLERRQLDVERQRLRVIDQQSGGGCKGLFLSNKTWICIAITVVAVLIFAAGAVVAICGFGDCNPSSSNRTADSEDSSTNHGTVAASPMPNQAFLLPSAVPTSQRPVSNKPTTTSSSTSTTSDPIAYRSVAERKFIHSFINSVTLSGQTLSYPGTATEGERALQWLIEQDLTTPASDQMSLIQRFVLAILWFLPTTTTATAFSDSRYFSTWTSSNSECDWHGVDCDGDGRVIRLNLGNANIRGRIPADLGLLTNLQALYLLGNPLTGTIPSSLGRLVVLQELELSNNTLTGTLPSSLGALTALTGLELNHNQLNGTIPSSWDALTALTRLDLENNQLMGTIPASLVALTALTQLWMFNNQIIGATPFCSLNHTFVELVLDCNKVTCPCCTHCCPTGGWDGIEGFDGCGDD